MKTLFSIFLFLFLTSFVYAQKLDLVPTEKKPKQFLEYYIGDLVASLHGYIL